MDAAWLSLMGVDPRDLQLNRTESYDVNISPQENTSNGIQYNDDSWPIVQASTGGFMHTTLAGPHLDIGVFDVEMPALGGNYQTNGAPVLERDDVWYLQGHQEDFVGIRNLIPTPNVDLTSQQPLPPFLCPLVEQVPSEIPQFSNQDQHTMRVHPPANSQRSKVPSSTHTLRGVSPQARRTRCLRRGDYVRASRTMSSRSTTSPMSRNRRPDPPQKLAPALSGSAQGKAPKGARNLSSAQSSGECDTERNASNHHITVLREAIALTRESIKPFSPFSRRKATDLIKQVAELIDQLELLAVEEEKYGNASSDDDEATQPSTTASSQDKLSNSELVDVDSETDNTSISSTSHQPIVDGQNSVSVEDDRREPVHRPCLQCGNKSLYYCTREGCVYSTHAPAEWKRHEESQKHSQRERFMCLECPQSPPATDMNGDSVCEFCRTSFPDLGTNLTAHYLQCQSAQKSCTTYGRKDRLIAHLRTQHRIDAHVSHIAAAGKFTIDCEWPRQCGFCGVTFMTWDERMDHIASHFEDGLDMSSWKRPLPSPKDRHPGLGPQPKDGDDSDDDMDDNDSRPSRHRTRIREKENLPPSNQSKTTSKQKGRAASRQEGRRQRQQVPLADLETEADSDASSNSAEIRGTLAAEQVMHRTSASGLKTTSVALDRYLNDVEEPFQLRTIPEDSVLALKKLTTYSAFTIRKCRPRYPKKEGKETWTKSEITEEIWAQEDIIKQIKKLNDSPRSVADKKRALMPYQQEQVTNLLDDLASGENGSVFEWSLVQLDSVTKPFSILKGGKKREMYETVTIIAFIKRAPRKGHSHSMPLEDKEKWPKGGKILKAHQAGSWPAATGFEANFNDSGFCDCEDETNAHSHDYEDWIIFPGQIPLISTDNFFADLDSSTKASREFQFQEMERRRRRESPNLLEQGERDNVNEHIQELHHLISPCQLKDEKIRKTLKKNSPLSIALASAYRPPRASSDLAGLSARRATAINSTTDIPIKGNGKRPDKGDVPNSPANWSRDLSEEIFKFCRTSSFAEFEDKMRMRTELMDGMVKNDTFKSHYSLAQKYADVKGPFDIETRLIRSKSLKEATRAQDLYDTCKLEMLPESNSKTTLDGLLRIPNFKAQVQRLNPAMDFRHNWLVSKIAHRREERYKSLIKMRIKHSLGTLERDRAAGPHCITSGASATRFDSRGNQKKQENETALPDQHSLLHAFPDFANDDFDTGEASLTDEAFSSMPFATCFIASQSSSKQHQTPSLSAETYDASRVAKFDLSLGDPISSLLSASIPYQAPCIPANLYLLRDTGYKFDTEDSRLSCRAVAGSAFDHEEQAYEGNSGTASSLYIGSCKGDNDVITRTMSNGWLFCLLDSRSGTLSAVNRDCWRVIALKRIGRHQEVL